MFNIKIKRKALRRLTKLDLLIKSCWNIKVKSVCLKIPPPSPHKLINLKKQVSRLFAKKVYI